MRVMPTTGPRSTRTTGLTPPSDHRLLHASWPEGETRIHEPGASTTQRRAREWRSSNARRPRDVGSGLRLRSSKRLVQGQGLRTPEQGWGLTKSSFSAFRAVVDFTIRPRSPESLGRGRSVRLCLMTGGGWLHRHWEARKRSVDVIGGKVGISQPTR